LTGWAARLRALVDEYDAKWSALDLAGVAALWEDDTPQPVYIGDEYAMPLIGADELDRHWARVAGRLKRASVSSQLRSADLLADGFARCIVLSRWSFTGRESDVAHTGRSWITWLVVARGDKYRIFHHMESQVYLDDHDDRDRSRAAERPP
jgi:ketosteroid isomerase-like protein